MSTDPHIRREEQIAAEAEEERDEALQEWIERSLAYLWESCGRTLPWNDAGPGEGLNSSEVYRTLPNMEETRTEKISAMLTAAMLRKLDAYAAEHHWSRSTAAAVLIEQGLSEEKDL